MSVVAESEALHARVRAFARGALGGAPSHDTFDSLALDIARYQVRHVPGVARLVHARARALSGVEDVPAVPVEAFRVARVAAHPEELDEARFLTSGTSAAVPGLHAMRSTGTYRELALLWGRRALVPRGGGSRVVVALVPRPSVSPSSSLAFMAGAFMAEFDGRPLPGDEAFDPLSSSRWLASAAGVDVDGLLRAVEHAHRLDEPLLLIATGFALVLLLDALGGREVAVPRNSVVMPTGGFKGRTREVGAEDLARSVARILGLERAQVVGEYGMTELSSQLYEGTLPSGELAAPPGVFLPPPWLAAVPVDPLTLAPVPDGDVGLARFVDLANVDSALAIVTHDRIVRDGPGIRLLGRAEGAPPRGCSLALSELIAWASGPP